MSKLRILFFFFSLCFISILVKLFYIQAIASDVYFVNNSLKTQRIMPDRGVIYDRNREPLVLNQPTYLLYGEPKKTKDKNAVIKKIDSVLKLGEATLAGKFDMSKNWVALATQVTKEQKDSLDKLKIEALGFNETSKRFYPEASSAAQLLGFVGKTSEGDDVGYFGVEGYYDKDLAGLPGLFRTERDLFGNPIVIGVQNRIKGENGRDLVLTIDKTVQRIVKEKIKDGMAQFGAKEGCAIAANPKTGEILGMSCVPDFDPDKYYEFSEDFFKNAAISNVYEPGSIFKPLIMSAAIQEKAVKPSDIYHETGPISLGGYTISTWDDNYEGDITITRILEKSSNVGMVYVGEKLGRDKTYQYLYKFGIGQKTGIDLQGETAGNLKVPKNWYPIDYSTVTFGQGIVVTPIQMIRAFSAIINGGNLMRPYIVREIVSESGTVDKIAPQLQGRVISKEASATMRQMLQSTVEHAEAKWKRPKGYAVGGKTGTAQIPVAGHYDPTKTIASFIGFAPVDNPQFVVLVIFKEPSSSPWGSETAAPIFFEIAKELLVYYNISPQ